MRGVFTAPYISQPFTYVKRTQGGHGEEGRQDGQGDDNDSGGGVLQHVFDRSDLRATRGERSPDRGRGLGTCEKAEERIASTVSLVAVVRRLFDIDSEAPARVYRGPRALRLLTNLPFLRGKPRCPHEPGCPHLSTADFLSCRTIANR